MAMAVTVSGTTGTSSVRTLSVTGGAATTNYTMSFVHPGGQNETIAFKTDGSGNATVKHNPNQAGNYTITVTHSSTDLTSNYYS